MTHLIKIRLTKNEVIVLEQLLGVLATIQTINLIEAVSSINTRDEKHKQLALKLLKIQRSTVLQRLYNKFKEKA